MSKKWPPKDPDEVLDYEADWLARVTSSDNINSSTWTVPAGITKDSDSFDDDATVIWLSGGTTGETYSLLNRITTAGGRTMDQTIRIAIKDK